MKYSGISGESFEVVNITSENCYVLKESKKSELTLLWFTENANELIIDTQPMTFDKNTLITLTEFHQVRPVKITGLKMLRFNRPFYCIIDHDSEVGCRGVLFFGSSILPRLQPSEKEIELLEAVWKMLLLEMESKDELQLEMLQMMLKRILILCIRIYKQQHNISELDQSKVDIIRAFNYLVETHFREKHTVAEYAELLFKSPKTLANLFSKMGSKSPLQYIQERILLEARRALTYTDKPIAEIGEELGFNDIQSFSRFFKKQQGLSPSDFRAEK